jgi:ketosteroid isomerase-like protein
MDDAAVEQFAAQWERAWNEQDLDGLLGHFSDDVLWTSPVAGQLVAGSGGVLKGKEALRAYFSQGMQPGREVHFEVVGVYRGVGTIVINYRNQRGGLVNEVLVLGQDGRVSEGHATYLSTGSAEQGLPGTG